MKLMIIPLLFACEVETQAKPFALEQSFYDWSCQDFEGYSEVAVSTQTCDADIQFIVAELQLSTGKTIKTNLKTSFEGSCDWEESFFIVDEQCDQVEGVALTAFAE